ncbi:MAG: DNA polymerase III subunit gamma/tau [Pedosphaera sp.]|nr:DNA polymerase III subunit gamma/tau [Pedosphaera sp.]
MSYQVIARKYRPQRFADVVGQEHVTQTLANAIAASRIAHAYLFCGPRGTGKTTIARIFAKALNCTDGPKADFDVADSRCMEIAEGRALDVLEIDGASNNGVEQVRELRETCKFSPASGKFKIYIIDEVHMLSTAAFNALLKTLEEPPAHVKFLFATTDPQKVLPTILSRCQRFDLRRIPNRLIIQHLAAIAQNEKVKIDDAALHAIARGADGGMRDAESTLDQLISFCGDSIEESDVLSMFGLTARSQILALSRAVLTGEAETVLRELNSLASGGKDLARLLGDLLSHFRNLLIYQISKGDLSLLEVSEAEKTALAEQSKLATTDALARILETLTDTEGRLRDVASKKILIEVALLKTIEAARAVSLDVVLKQLQQLRAESGGALPALAPVSTASPRAAIISETAPTTYSAPKPAPTPSVPATAAPAAPAISDTPASSAHAGGVIDLSALWTQLLGAIGRVSQFTRSYLIEAHPVSFAKETLVVGFDPEFADHLSLVDNPKNHALIQTKLREMGHAHATVKFVKAERSVGFITARSAAPAPPAPVPEPATKSAPATLAEPAAFAEPTKKKTSVPFSMEEFKDDPLIKQALEIFKGQIIDVRK